jgi:hypothetical protein
VLIPPSRPGRRFDDGCAVTLQVEKLHSVNTLGIGRELQALRIQHRHLFVCKPSMLIRQDNEFVTVVFLDTIERQPV